MTQPIPRLTPMRSTRTPAAVALIRFYVRLIFCRHPRAADQMTLMVLAPQM